jgi:hypothetical protein
VDKAHAKGLPEDANAKASKVSIYFGGSFFLNETLFVLEPSFRGPNKPLVGVNFKSHL